jgi:teichoic acid transport system permease protein
VSQENLAAYAAEHGLKRMGARPSFFSYVAEAWHRRDFAVALSLFTNEAANARNRLGKWWNILLPTIQAATYGLIFGVILGDSRPDNFLPFLFTGVFLFSFMSGSFYSGASSITSNSGLVKSLSFPRALLPISTVISQFMNLIPQLGILLVTLLIIQHEITWGWLALIPIVFLMTLFSAGLAMIAARLTVQVRDLSKLIPFFTRIAFYVSGIFFSVEAVLANYPQIFAIVKYNPVYDYIEIARGAVVKGYTMETDIWIACGAWAVVTFVVGSIFFWKAEEEYGRD